MHEANKEEKMKLLFIYTHNGYRDFFLHKDVGMVPSFLSGNNEVDSLFYVESKKGSMKFKNLRISYTGKNWFISNFCSFLFLLKNRLRCSDYDLLVFHLSIRNIIPIILFKLLFKGNVICKMDLNTESAKAYCDNSGGILKRILMKLMAWLTDHFYVETSRNYEIVKNGIFGIDISKKIELLPNGVDEKLVISVVNDGGIVLRNKVITIISRFESEDKAPHRILDVVEIMSDLSLHDWQFNIIGSFPDTFINKLERKAKQFNVNVTCTGKNKELNEVYEELYRSEIFLCLSREESYCISLVEAAVFNNYIITTNVGVAEDLSKIYEKVDIMNNYTKKELNELIKNVTEKYESGNAKISKETLNFYSWDKIVHRTLRK